MSAIFKREFKSYFSTPIGFIVIAAFYFFLGLYFSFIYSYGVPDISIVVMNMSSIVVFALPMLTMRLMSEDKRQKVDQALLTAPVGLTSIVMGKFLATMAVFAIGFAPTVIFEIIVTAYVTVNIMSYVYAIIGMMLLGGTLIAIGMFISSLTESSVISAILTLVINILVLYMPNLADMINLEGLEKIADKIESERLAKMIEWLAKIIEKMFEKMSFMTTFENFGANIFSIADIVYFVSIITIFLFLCVRSLEKRRWA